jgi:hypothetical protein
MTHEPLCLTIRFVPALSRFRDDKGNQAKILSRRYLVRSLRHVLWHWVNGNGRNQRNARRHHVGVNDEP